MNIRFQTNLDGMGRYLDQLNGYAGPVMRVGTRVSFSSNNPSKPKNVFELEVCQVTYHTSGMWTIELHLPSWFRGSIKQWEEWLDGHMK